MRDEPRRGAGLLVTDRDWRHRAGLQIGEGRTNGEGDTEREVSTSGRSSRYGIPEPNRESEEKERGSSSDESSAWSGQQAVELQPDASRAPASEVDHHLDRHQRLAAALSREEHLQPLHLSESGLGEIQVSGDNCCRGERQRQLSSWQIVRVAHGQRFKTRVRSYVRARTLTPDRDTRSVGDAPERNRWPGISPTTTRNSRKVLLHLGNDLRGDADLGETRVENPAEGGPSGVFGAVACILQEDVGINHERR